MQGQRSAIGSLPDSINFDHGSTPSSVGIDQQLCWNNVREPNESRLSDFRVSASNTDTYMGSVGQEGLHMSRWNTGEASSSNAQTFFNYAEQLPPNLWSSSMGAPPSAGPVLQEYETPNDFFRHNVDLNIGNDEMVNGPPFARSSNGGSTSQVPDINVGIVGHVGGNPVECPHSLKSSGSDNKLIHAGSGSSDPFASSSGTGGFIIEEDEGRPGCSFDGGRLSCKRKALERQIEQSSNGGNCFPRPESSSIWQPAPCYDAGSSLNASENPVGEQVIPRLGLGRGGLAPERFHAPKIAGSESSQRNYRMRMNPSSSALPDSVSSNPFLPSATTRRPDAPHVHQPLRFVPANPPLDLVLPPPENPPPSHQSAGLRMPALHRHAHNLRWNGAPSSRAGSSSASAAPGERDVALLEDLNSRTRPRSIADHPMLVPAVEMRNSSQGPTNFRLSNGSGGLSSNASSSSRSRSGASWASHRSPSSSQYSRRLSELVRRSLLSSVGPDIGGQNNNASVQRSTPPASQEAGLPSGAGTGSQGHNPSYLRSALWLERERQGDGAIRLPYLRTLAAGEGRSRIASELQIRNLLDIMRRGEGLRMEDVMILDHNMFFGMADMHDQHRGMRLDVDNMSYEELLALEERIGNVCTGLTEEMILKRMKQRKHISTMTEDENETEPCCVCQEEYKDGDDLGTLDCGHDFHKECIKQWLGHKNLCPICKTTGLSTS